MNALVKDHRRSLVTLVLFVCLQATAWGQPKAAFHATTLSGCSPLLVYFFDSSAGNPTQWKWDLGNGTTSFLRNPSATYFNPGSYTIKLIVSNASGSDTIIKSQYITVNGNPSVGFELDKTTGCFPLPVQFTDKSTPGSGSIATWQWDFGDGNLSDLQNPQHVYTSAGTFSVTLRVTNSLGCVKSFTQTQAISIANGVKAGFTFTDPGLCPAPATSQFTNTSTGPGPLQYQWNFGDGTVSTANSPAHNYTTNGNYSVSLIATSPQGCVDTVTQKDILKIGAAKASFDYPASVCVNTPVQFTNTSSPKPLSVKWDFGNASYSTITSPVKTYTVAGMYTVKLITDFGSCIDTVKKLISIEAKPVADFTTSQQALCRLPVNVQFTSLATGYNYKYAWDFGDGTKGSISNPSHVYTKEGNYTVKLIVTNGGGCSDTIIKKNFVQVQVPHVTTTGLPAFGCGPIFISPRAVASAGQTITSYLWTFGDGTTSTDSTPTHTYSVKGNYTVSLAVTLSGGCTDTIVMPAGVRVGEKPTAAFTNRPTSVCPFEKVFFSDKSTGADQWFWTFGDGGTSTEVNPIHQYSDTGWQKVTLVVYNNTCPDTIVVSNAVHVNPPVSIFEVRQNCQDKFTKTFVDRSLGPETWFWDFGDGTTSTQQSPVHVYAGTGKYTVKLTVTNGGCSHFSVKTVMVIDEAAAFTSPDSVLCRNSTATFTSQGINAANIANWTWNFGDGTSSLTAKAASHLYTASGTYEAVLTITDLLGCKSTQKMPVTVFGPTASFKPSVAASCLLNNNISFTDSSTSDGKHPIMQWIWNYGDSTIDSASKAPFAHSYGKAGLYTIGLTVVDDFGCADSLVKTAAITIAQPVALFNTVDSMTCTGKTIAFKNTSDAIAPYFDWSFGDGGTSALTHPLHAYASVGTYSVKLLVTDKFGCKDSLEKPAYINVSYPKAKFSLSDSIGTCPPLLVHFTNESTDYSRILWDFGDGNTSALDTPSHFYSTPGTFDAVLIATGPGGCTDTIHKKIVVKGPIGTFTYKPLVGCKPLVVNFTASTKNNASFIWDFSDGATASTKVTTTSHSYTSLGDFVPKMILTDAGGCSVPIMGLDTIRVKGVSIDFAMDSSKFCTVGTVHFNNQTVSNDFISSYQWNFGDGATSSAASPSHQYPSPGTYSVKLLVTTESGCTEEKTLLDTVSVYAAPVVTITGDSAACAPADFTFKGQVKSGNATGMTWAWDLANGQTSTLQNPVAQHYEKDGSYTISTIATDSHGCSDTATRQATVYPIPQTEAGPDSWICRGNFQQLKATGAATYHWQAASSLSCTDCDSPLAAPTDSIRYFVTGFNSFGCNTRDSVMVRVHQPFTLTVEKGDTICAGKTIRLAAAGADQYTWTPAPDVKEPSNGITTAVPQMSTLYHVVAKDNFNCFSDSGSVYIKVWPMPVVKVEAAQTLSIGSTLTLAPTYSTDVTTYQWSNAQTLSCATCPSPVAKPKDETTYTIDVKNDGGCEAKASVTVHVICNNGNLFIPNTFSPNSDGRNDRFYPRGTGISTIKSLKVYNRWGQLVFNRENFSANDAEAGWDGNYKGQALAPDVYIYTCDVVCMNNEVLSYRGDVTLLR